MLVFNLVVYTTFDSFTIWVVDYVTVHHHGDDNDVEESPKQRVI